VWLFAQDYTISEQGVLWFHLLCTWPADGIWQFFASHKAYIHTLMYNLHHAGPNIFASLQPPNAFQTKTDQNIPEFCVLLEWLHSDEGLD
jgi:hypothetical protein